jgi:hypothetical protein
MSGALALNTPPFLTAPPDFASDFDAPAPPSILLTSIVNALNAESCKLFDISQALLSVSRLSTPMNNKIGDCINRAKDGIPYLNMMLPAAHQIIGLPQEVDVGFDTSIDTIDLLRDTTRLCCRLYMSIMKWKLCAAPEGVMELNYLMSRALACGVYWTPALQPLRLWTMIVFAISYTMEEVPEWVITEIVSSMEQSGLSTWNQVEATLHEIAWLDLPFCKVLNSVKEQVERNGKHSETETTSSMTSASISDDGVELQ